MLLYPFSGCVIRFRCNRGLSEGSGNTNSIRKLMSLVRRDTWLHERWANMLKWREQAGDYISFSILDGKNCGRSLLLPMYDSLNYIPSCVN